MTNEEAQNLLDDIDSQGREITDWELDFIDQMLKKTDQGYEPTVKEAAVIRRIYGDRVK